MEFKYFLYGGIHPQNTQVDSFVLKNLHKSLPKKLCYLSPEEEYGKKEFLWTAKRFMNKGIKNCFYISLDYPFTKFHLGHLQKASLIFLGGGNTYLFLQRLRHSSFWNEIKEILQDPKKVIVGVSAGGILLTHNIVMASIPSKTRDKNEVQTRWRSAFNLIPDLFSPHYEEFRPSFHQEIKREAKKQKKTIWGVADGAGIAYSSCTSYKLLIGKVVSFIP